MMSSLIKSLSLLSITQSIGTIVKSPAGYQTNPDHFLQKTPHVISASSTIPQGAYYSPEALAQTLIPTNNTNHGGYDKAGSYEDPQDHERMVRDHFIKNTTGMSKYALNLDAKTFNVDPYNPELATTRQSKNISPESYGLFRLPLTNPGIQNAQHKIGYIATPYTEKSQSVMGLVFSEKSDSPAINITPKFGSLAIGLEPKQLCSYGRPELKVYKNNILHKVVPLINESASEYNPLLPPQLQNQTLSSKFTEVLKGHITLYPYSDYDFYLDKLASSNKPHNNSGGGTSPTEPNNHQIEKGIVVQPVYGEFGEMLYAVEEGYSRHNGGKYTDKIKLCAEKRIDTGLIRFLNISKIVAVEENYGEYDEYTYMVEHNSGINLPISFSLNASFGKNAYDLSFCENSHIGGDWINNNQEELEKYPYIAEPAVYDYNYA